MPYITVGVVRTVEVANTRSVQTEECSREEVLLQEEQKDHCNINCDWINNNETMKMLAIDLSQYACPKPLGAHPNDGMRWIQRVAILKKTLLTHRPDLLPREDSRDYVREKKRNSTFVLISMFFKKKDSMFLKNNTLKYRIGGIASNVVWRAERKSRRTAWEQSAIEWEWIILSKGDNLGNRPIPWIWLNCFDRISSEEPRQDRFLFCDREFLA